MVVLEVIVLKGLIVHQSSMKITLDLKEISSQTKKYLKEEKVKQSRQKYSCQWPPSTFPTPLPPDWLPAPLREFPDWEKIDLSTRSVNSAAC